MTGPWCAVLAAAALAVGAGHGGLNRAGWRPERGSGDEPGSGHELGPGYEPGSRSAPGPGPGPGPERAAVLRVVSWNTEYWHQGQRPDRFYGFLQSRQADVYLLQEYVYGPHQDLRPVPDLPALRCAFPDHHVAAAGELVTVSRFPIQAIPPVGPAAQLPPRARWRDVFDRTKVLRTDLRIGTRTVSVYNVHIPAQYVRADNPLAPGFYPQLRERDASRKAQLAGLQADLDGNGNPLLVSGDLNTTGAMRDIRPLARRLASANRACRRLYPASWPARGPALWQLDWTFTRGLRVHRYRFVDPQELSDHRMQELLVSIPD